MKKLLAIVFALNCSLMAPRLAIPATGCTYPSTLDTFADVAAAQTLTATLFNKLQCAAEKIEAELGTNPKGSYATVVARLNDGVYTTRTLTAGTGLTGGGDLSANRSFAVDTAVVATLTGSQTFSNHVLDNTNTINVKDTLLRIQDDGDTSKQAAFQASGITTATTRNYTLPNSDGTLVLESRSIATSTGLSGGGDLSANRTLTIDSTVATLTGSQTLDNKTLSNTTVANIKDANFTLQDDGDSSKLVRFQLSGLTTATTRVFTAPNADGTLLLQSRSVATGTGLSGGGDLSADRTLTIDSTVATLTGSQSLTNKTLDNSNIATLRDDRFTLQDNLDTTKQAALQLSSISTGTTRTYTLPNASGIVVLESASVTNTGVTLHATGPGLETTSGLSLKRDCSNNQILKWTSGSSTWGCAADDASAGTTLNSWGSRGQKSKNNTGTPNTKFDLIADSVILRNSSNGVIVFHAPSTVTNDVTVSSGTDNGRDQSGAFSASSWIHFYWVSDGSTLKSRSSTVAPPTGPTLQGAETHWSYAGAVRFNGSSQLLLTRIMGNFASYDEDSSVLQLLAAGSATAYTAVDLSSLVPPNASHSWVEFLASASHGTPGTDIGARLRVSGTAATGENTLRVGNVAQVASQTIESRVWGFVPNVSQSVDYRMNTAPASAGAYLLIFGYKLPNGG